MNISEKIEEEIPESISQKLNSNWTGNIRSLAAATAQKDCLELQALVQPKTRVIHKEDQERE